MRAQILSKWSGGALVVDSTEYHVGRKPRKKRNRKIYPNEESALKLVFMAIREASKKWTKPIHHWKQALNHFAILYEDRVPELTNN